MTELTQAEINRLEQANYDAQRDREDAADQLMWSLRTLKQNSPSKYAVVLAALVAEIPDADELVDQWIDASRRENETRNPW